MKDMHFNLILYVCIAVFGFLNTQFGGEEAAKFLSPLALFWFKTVFGSLSAGCLAAKLFLSTSFADWQAKRSNGHSTDASPAPPPPISETPKT